MRFEPHPAASFFKSNSLKLGDRQAIIATVIKHTTPPKMTDGTTPISRAATPDSNSPISFEEPIKMEFTEETFPRILSGDESCTAEDRITILTLSKAPLRANATADNMKL
jgi:hypothetical protein